MYRLLELGDTVMYTDERYIPTLARWVKVVHSGYTITENTSIIRRKIKYSKEEFREFFAKLFDIIDGSDNPKISGKTYDILLDLAKDHGFDYEKELEYITSHYKE